MKLSREQHSRQIFGLESIVSEPELPVDTTEQTQMSGYTEEVDILNQVGEYLQTGNGDGEGLIGQLGQIVHRSSMLMQDQDMWDYVTSLGKDIEIQNAINKNLEAVICIVDYRTDQLRILKGLVLLVRNFSLVHDLTYETYALICRVLDRLKGGLNDEELALRSLDISIISFHCVMNYLKSGAELRLGESIVSSLEDVVDQLQNTGGLFELRQLIPLVKQCCDDPEIKSVIKEQSCRVVIKLIKAISRVIDFHNDTDVHELQESGKHEYSIIVQLAEIMIQFYDDETFGIAAYKLEKEENTENSVLLYLTACQMVFSCEPLEEWNYVAIGAIILDFFYIYIDRCSKLLVAVEYDEEELKVNHRKIISLFDIITNLMPYEMFKKVMNSYDVLDKLIGFFHIVENNTERKRLKEEQIVNLEKKNFGNVKTIMIEIITYFVHNDKKNQDLVREKGGLILLLNNCNLDINEPFIRERSILCLKYLLENNPENQTFVASLEANGVEINKDNEEVLEKCGYEVEIVDGKVQLKRSVPK